MGAWLSFFLLLPMPRAAEHVEVVARATAAHVFAPAASSDLADARLRVTGGDAGEWVRYARQAAGASTGTAVIRVDGLESEALPPATTIARIQVNPDPFSAEFAEPGTARVEITTRGPSRTFRWSFGTTALGAGGASPLAAGTARARGFSIAVSGGVPRLPVTFTLSTDVSRTVTPAAMLAPGAAAGAAAADQTRRLSASVFHTSRAIAWRARYVRLRSSAANAGIGGTRTIEAGHDEQTGRDELHVTAARETPPSDVRGGVSLSIDRRAASGATPGPAIDVPGVLAAHAAPLASDASARRTLRARITAERRGHGLSVQAGASLALTAQRLDRQPNPAGTLVFTSWTDFAAAGAGDARAGTLFIRDGNGRADVRTTEASLFLQGLLSATPGRAVRAGVRLDHQSRDGMRISPRVSAGWRAGGFLLSGGAGLFTHATPADLFARVVMGDALHLRERIVTGAGLGGVDAARIATAPLVVSVFDPAYRRRTDLVLKGSAARSLRAIHAQLEYAYTRGRHAPGTVRTPGAGGWEDRFTSGFGVERHHLHLAMRWQHRAQIVTAHVEALSARDQTGGALDIQPPTAHGRPAWARSAGVPPLRVSAVGAFVLPVAIQLSILVSSSGPVPYDVIAPAFARDFSLTERNGATRNSGRVPSTHAIDVHAARDLRVPRALRRVLGDRLSAGLRVDNVLNRTNITALGEVIGTPLFTHAIDAAPSRSLRVWLSF